MELNSKDDLYSTLDEILARLSVIEQSTNEKPKDEMPKDDDNSKDETTEVETVDEIEKLLNSQRFAVDLKQVFDDYRIVRFVSVCCVAYAP